MDIGYHDQPFSLCYQREEGDRIWKRLDRAMVNDKWFHEIPETTINHLSLMGSNHCPLLLEMSI